MFPYQDSTLSPEKRAEDLLSRMTMEEKIGQTVMEIVAAFPDEKTAFEKIRAGTFGSFILSRTAFPGNSTASGIDVGFLNRCQRAAVKESRLGIPLIFGRDIIHGHYTISPIPLAQAASFRPENAEESARIARDEARAESVHWTFAPMMDICRDPRWGRVIETFGEDPRLASEMAVAAVKGYQGNDPSGKTEMTACAKHFAGYGYAEGGRDYDSAEISRFTMLNTVLAPFRAAVEKAHVGSVMTSFQVTGGTPSSSDNFLLRDTLRKSWKFDGVVVSDFGSIDEVELHGAAQDERDGTEKCFHAGVDIEMCNNLYPKYLPGLIESGKVPSEDLDRAVRAVLLMKFRAGLFENPYTDEHAGEKIIFTQEKREAVRRIAADCMVLAKNSHTFLPLDKAEGKTIALIGPMVHERSSLRGAWCGSGSVSETATLAEAFAENSNGAKILTTESALSDDQFRLARRADIVICCVGESSSGTGECHASARLALPPGQEEFVHAVLSAGKPTAVLVVSGRPLPVLAAEERADAILYTWHGGTETARAAADVVFGRREPGGRFPITVPASVGQIPIYYGRKRPGKLAKEFLIRQNYQFYDDASIRPLHAFGSGLSYTTFSLSKLTLEKTEIERGENATAHVTLTNTGKRAGSAVVQCYLRDTRCSCARPYLELCGFVKKYLKPGENAEIEFTVTPESMGFYDEDGVFRIESGEFRIGAGLSSDMDAEEKFVLL